MTQLSDADREFAVELVKEVRSALESVGFAWAYPGSAEKIVNKARALRDAELAPEIAALRAENTRLREALEWYANPVIYKPHPHGPAFDARDLSWKARAALGGENG